MTTEMFRNRDDERSGMFLFILYAACFLVVALYVNMFQFWAWVSKELGPGMMIKMLPILVTLAVLSVISLRVVQRVNRGYRIKFVFLGLGIVMAFLALAIPDPRIPIKRVHVAEYIILSFLVRYTLSHRFAGYRLMLFTILVTALYGVHDEMLQGLHPNRYFGWRDIIVNSVAGSSGALLGHGLVCFDAQRSGKTSGPGQPVSVGQWVLYATLLAAVVWEVIYLYRHSGSGVVYPALIPVIVCCLIIACLYPKLAFSSTTNHGLRVVFWLALGLAVYPVLAGVSWLEFL